MSRHYCRKEKKEWVIDIPQELKERYQKEKQEIGEEDGALLDLVAHGEETMFVSVDTEPLKGADVLRLIKLGNAFSGGGYYKMCSFSGRTLKRKIWLCDMPLFIFGDLPEKIYIKKVVAN